MGLNPAQAKGRRPGTQTLPNEPFMGKGETMTDPMSLTFLGGAFYSIDMLPDRKSVV